MTQPTTSTQTPSRAAFDPRAWERGCAADPVRNEVILPHLAASLATAAPQTVVDLGSGTGYITRTLSAQPWADSVGWVLLDSNPDLLDIALASFDTSIDVTGCLYDLTGPEKAPAVRAEAAFAVFTFLEFPATPILARNCAGLLSPGGTLLVYLPDTLADVLALGDPAALSDLRAGACVVEKRDHFTGALDAFNATRIELLLSLFLRVELRLLGLDILERTDRRESLFCLRLERPPTRAD
ncbi:MAG TPA: hypothetical protein VIS51_12130 [Solirubrobacterales bacterium]